MGRMTVGDTRWIKHGATKMPFDFPAFGRSNWAYRDCFTINPTKGAKAWERLNLNQWGLEVGMLPKTLHEALLETLDERHTLENSAKKRVG